MDPFFLFFEKKMQVVQWGLESNLLWEVVVFSFHFQIVTQNQVMYLHERAKPLYFSPKMHRNEVFGIWNCSFPFKLFLRSSLLYFFFSWKWLLILIGSSKLRKKKVVWTDFFCTTPFLLMMLILSKTSLNILCCPFPPFPPLLSTGKTAGL